MAKIYSIYIDPSSTAPLESAEFIEERFCFPAFIFSGLWLLYHRLWVPLLVVILLRLGVEALIHAELLNLSSRWITELAIAFYIALSAADLRGARLHNKGYILSDVRVADGLLPAQQRFFERKLNSSSATVNG